MDAVDLDGLVEKSLIEHLELNEVQDMSSSSKCALIKRITERRKLQRNISSVDTALASIRTLNATFNITSGFHEWQRRRRQSLIAEITKPSNRPILTAYRMWDSLTVNAKKCVLKRSVKLHRDIYLNGMFERLPFKHEFREGAFRRIQGELVLTFGNFSGDIRTGRSTITQFLQHGELLKDPKEAFNTAHHEATHLIQHHFSVAMFRNQISASHPLFNEASYFFSVDRHKAYIPSAYQSAYKSQPIEIFADWEGEKISDAIKSLAL